MDKAELRGDWRNPKRNEARFLRDFDSIDIPLVDPGEAY
jgi:hypothetical protein